MLKQLQRIISLTLVFAVVFWCHPAEVAPALAATPCGSQAKVSGRLNFASRVEPGRVLICADWLKVETKTSTKSTPTNPVARLPKSVPTPRVKKPTKKSTHSAIRYSHSTSAAPARPRIAISNRTPKTLEPIRVAASTRAHSRFRYLLGIPAEVRFTPVSFRWKFGDGKTSTKKSTRESYSQQGQKLVELDVKFSVAFRFAGSKYWRKLSKSIWLDAQPVMVQVGLTADKHAPPRFVYYDCLQQPTAQGCFG